MLTARFDMAMSWKNDLHLTVPDRAQLITGERHRYRSKHVNGNHIKFHYDGNPMGRTSLYIDNYRGFDHNGKTNETLQEMKDLLIDMDKRGITCNIHAVGDLAIRQALDAIEHAREANGMNGPRHVVLHTAYMHPDDGARFKELDAISEYTYSYILQEMKPLADWLADEVLPESAVNRLINIKPILDHGGVAVFGSDLVVASTPEPYECLATVTARTSPFESITMEQAIKMMTLNGAYAMGIENVAGSIEVGKYADMVVLDGNPFEGDKAQIAQIKAMRTIFEGKQVFKR